jgi:putative glycosyltransferase (TIGR04372 family)
MIFKEIIKIVVGNTIVPFTARIAKYKKIRISLVRADRLGHLSLNTHLFFIRSKINTLENFNYLLISPSLKSKKIANASLLSMFITHSKSINNINFICSSILYFFFTYFQTEFKKYKLIYNLNMNSNESEFSLGVKTISFSKNQKKYGEATLGEMPFPKNKKIVTIFARDSSYLDMRFPNNDWSYHSYRNCDIETYIDAIKYLIKRNYTVLRIGSEFSKKLDFEDQNYFDYSLSKYKSAFMDLFLVYKSEFMLGSTSGATDVAAVFNTPFVGVNYAPFMEAPLGRDDIFIQKKLINLQGETIPYKDIISDSRYYSFDGNKMNQLYDIKYVDNSAEEVLDVVEEMDDLLNGNLIFSDKQKKLLERYQNEYCLRNKWSKRFAPISIRWLEKNYYLYY